MNQALQLWKTQIPSYQASITKCLSKLSKPISLIPPADLQQRTQKLRQSLINTYQTQYQNLDVVLNSIEGQTNLTLMQLAKFLNSKLGRDPKYWQDRILQYANNQVYSQNLSIWQVKKEYQSYLYLTPESISNLRKFRKIAKNYIFQLKNLTKMIKKTQNISELSKIDEAYRRLKSAQQKYFGFLEEIQFNPLQDYGQHSNASLAARKNAKKTLFNFMKFQPMKTNQNILPLTKYNFMVNNERLTKTKQQKKVLNQKQFKQLEKYLKIMHSPILTINELKQQFIQQNKYEKSSKEKIKQQQIYTNIWDDCFYFSYSFHPVNTQFINFTQPSKIYPDINYQVNSQDQYNDLLGQDLNSNAQRSLSQDCNSEQSFLVSDYHLSQDQVSQKQPKIDLEKFMDHRWQFNKHDIIKDFDMIPLVELPIILDQTKLVKDFSDEQLSTLVHNKTRKQILANLTQMKQIISKQRLDDYLKKNCSRKRVNKITVYKVNTFENNLLTINSQLPEIIQTSAQKDCQQYTISGSKIIILQNSNDQTLDHILK